MGEAPAVPAPPEVRPPITGSSAPGRPRAIWREFPVLVIAAIAAALLIKTFLVQAFYIPSESMLPTLEIGDRVVVEKVSYRWSSPARGDIVVFERELGAPRGDEPAVWTRVKNAFAGLLGFPTGGDRDFIKRVVGVAGDEVEGRAGHLLVNGSEVREPYLAPGPATFDFPPVTVPQGMVFVMGDNRSGSEDSRRFGPVPVEEIIGKAVILVWPPSNFGAI